MNISPAFLSSIELAKQQESRSRLPLIFGAISLSALRSLITSPTLIRLFPVKKCLDLFELSFQGIFDQDPSISGLIRFCVPTYQPISITRLELRKLAQNQNI